MRNSDPMPALIADGRAKASSRQSGWGVAIVVHPLSSRKVRSLYRHTPNHAGDSTAGQDLDNQTS